MYKKSTKILFLLTLISLASSADAQEYLFGPSTNTMDSKSIFANPALISFQPSQLSLGIKTYHTGFFEESGFNYGQGFFTISNPRMYSRFGSGFQVQYFDSPIFSRSQTGGSISAELFNRVSIGVNASLLHVGYNQSNFVDFDFDDPVFDDGYSKFTFNTAAGIYARPFSMIEIAVGARNLNEPDISISGSGANEPRELFSAISLNYGILRGTVEMISRENEFENRSHIELYSSQGYYTRLGSSQNFESAFLEAQAHVYRGFSVNYQYQLPVNEMAGNTNGSHMISLSYEFGRVPSIPNQREPVDVYPTGQRPRSSPGIPPLHLLNSDTDHLEIQEINLSRQVDESSVTDDDIHSLTAYDIGRLEEVSDIDRIPYKQRETITEYMPESAVLSTPTSDRYERTLELLRDSFDNEELDDLQILIQDGEESRAAGLRNKIQDDSFVPVSVGNFLLPSETDSTLFQTEVDRNMIDDDQHLISVEPEIAKIVPVHLSDTDMQTWELIILDQDENVVESFEGTGELPESFEWDWIGNDGNLIEPGLYTYFLAWSDNNGEQHQTRNRNLFVQKIDREITLDITKDINNILSNPDNINIILKND